MALSQYFYNAQLTPVRLAGTSNVSATYYNGATNNGVGATLTVAASSLTIDSVATVAGDRVLLVSQTNTYENGIYQVTSIGSTVVLTRSEDFHSLEQMQLGAFCQVYAGTVHAGRSFTFTTKPAQLGVSALDFLAGTVAVSGSTVLNEIPTAADTAGTIKSSAGVTNTIGGAVVVAGNVTAGASGTAGVFTSYPATAARGALLVTAVANTGNTNVTISNAAHGQASVVSIPDGGQATANFIISASAGTQTIASGSLSVAAGNVSAGASGAAGTVRSFPATASRGALIVAAVNNTGNTDVTISNAAHGQATVVSIPDGGQTTTEFIIADSAGTQAITSGSLQVNAGNLLAGSSGNAGVLASFPATAARGSLRLTAVNNTGDSIVTISNVAHGQATVYSLADVGTATGSILNCTVAADPASNLIWSDTTVGQAALAAAGLVALVTSSGSKQYKVREIMHNDGGTDFSGGGGDRLGQVGDGTTIYTITPAASLQTIVNARWGSTAVAFPTAAAANTSTAAGANLRYSYNGGTTDYTAGSIVVSVMVQRVA